MFYKEYSDTCYPNTGYTRSRVSVRGLIFNHKNQCAMLKIEGEDIFDIRNHYETPGGGIQHHETREDTLHREILEEIGYECKIQDYLGMAINYYNPIEMIAINHFFVAKIRGNKKDTHLEEAEKLLFDSVQWHTPLEWLEILDVNAPLINGIIHQRERDILTYYLEKQDK